MRAAAALWTCNQRRLACPALAPRRRRTPAPPSPASHRPGGRAGARALLTCAPYTSLRKVSILSATSRRLST